MFYHVFVSISRNLLCSPNEFRSRMPGCLGAAVPRCKQDLCIGRQFAQFECQLCATDTGHYHICRQQGYFAPIFPSELHRLRRAARREHLIPHSGQHGADQPANRLFVIQHAYFARQLRPSHLLETPDRIVAVHKAARTNITGLNCDQRYWRAMFSFRIRDCKVVRFMPRRVAAPSGPPTWPFASSSAFMIACRSVA